MGTSRRRRWAAVLVAATGGCLLAAALRPRQNPGADVHVIFQSRFVSHVQPPTAWWVRASGPSVAVGVTEVFDVGDSVHAYVVDSRALEYDYWPRCSLAAKDRYVVVPLWLPGWVLLSLGAYLGMVGRRQLPGHCRCGYDLTGNVSGWCPECGTLVGAQS